MIYTKAEIVTDERVFYELKDLSTIPSVIKDFEFFVQPKYRIAASRPGSGNTKNIGSMTKIEQLIKGTGHFAELGEEIYDDYWMFYLTKDMAQTIGIERPYINLSTYYDYKNKGMDALRAHEEKILSIGEEEKPTSEEEVD